jgi:hypothetical protein
MSENSSIPSGHLHEDDSKLDEQLKRLYLDAKLDTSDREHSFYVYWLRHINLHKILVRRDLEDMLTCARSWSWWAPLGDCLRTAASMDIIAASDIEWLMRELPRDSYAWKQIVALHLLKDETVSTDYKLAGLLELGADWAIRCLIDSVEVRSLNSWSEIIKASRRPKGAKNNLITYIQKVISSHKI